MASSGSTLLSVSKQFVHSYYKILHQSPQELHRFYKEGSSFTCGSEATYGASEETVSGLEAITKKIQQLDFQNCRVTLSVVDAQSSVQGGIIIMVVGHLANKEESPRKFVQTFYLAEQSSTTSRGYYVHNDIFRYIDEAQGEDLEEEGDEEQEEIVAPEPSPPKEVNKPKESRPTVSEETPAPKVQKEAPQQAEPSPKPTPVAATNTNQEREESPKPSAPVKKTAPAAPVEDSKTISWAGLISKAQPQAEQTNAASVVNKGTPPAAAPQKAASSAPRKEERPAGNASLFVSNVPFNATEEQVRAIFAKFGEIKSVSVNNNKGLAFIDMANPDIALRAIDSGRNGELAMDGRTLSVAEKKPQKQGGSFRGEKDRGDQRGPRVDKRDRGDRGERVDRGERINGKTSAPREQRRQ